MIQIFTGSTNSIYYLSRYNRIDKFELYNHETSIIYSEVVSITAYEEGGKIYHSGITFNFKPNSLYTYKSYYKQNDIYYLANTSLLKTWIEDERIDDYVISNKPKNTFKIKK